MKPEQKLAIESLLQAIKTASDCGALDVIDDYCGNQESINDFCAAVENSLEFIPPDIAEIKWDDAVHVNSTDQDIHVADYVAYDGAFIQCVAESLDAVHAAADQWNEDMETNCHFEFFKVVE